MLDFETFEPTKIYRKNARVETMVWSPDGTQIMHVVHQTPELDSPSYSAVRFEVIPITGVSSSSPTLISHFPGPVSWAQLVWLSSHEIFFLAGATPRRRSPQSQCTGSSRRVKPGHGHDTRTVRLIALWMFVLSMELSLEKFKQGFLMRSMF